MRARIVMAALLLGGCVGTLGAADNPLKLQVVPAQDDATLRPAADRLVAALSEQTGLAVEAHVPAHYGELVADMGAGRSDVALMNVLTYLLAHDAFGAQAALAVERDGKTAFRGAIIGRRGSSLSAVDGGTVAYVDLHSVSGYLLPAELLSVSGLHPSQMVEGGSHAGVVRLVHAGRADAGFVYDDARHEVAAEIPGVMEDVVVLQTTRSVPNEPVVFREGVPAPVREAVVRGLLALAASDDGRRTLAQLNGITGLRLVEDGEYDGVREALTRLGKDIDEMVPGGGLVHLEAQHADASIPPLGG